eukprot:CAMPEP_0183431540 /NCGR_PEP_ID=MMETSP0370-20130417/54887_1 /TAXON_ID=268820 /ORGANISM="Peridinium aciculiferum, Strain PAER-2" /LENGTH=45 /DNA_ID= /DNA_START= /DNA_END= /DNA_ORIENTATION=
MRTAHIVSPVWRPCRRMSPALGSAAKHDQKQAAQTCLSVSGPNSH